MNTAATAAAATTTESTGSGARTTESAGPGARATGSTPEVLPAVRRTTAASAGGFDGNQVLAIVLAVLGTAVLWTAAVSATIAIATYTVLSRAGGYGELVTQFYLSLLS